ncbi:MAG: DNA repair protein RecO [Clostridia bacterium]|nr:DNA repair protein RecO [Clostridia bacterium]
MGIIKTKGIVLAQNNMGDNDKMITILTPDLGKIGCAAKGARRPKSALMSGTQFLCFASFLIYKGINSYNINSCEPIEIFYNIRLDLDKLEYASMVTKIAKDVTKENESSYNVLQLVLNTIYMISESDKDLDFILSIFKIRLLSIIGFRPIVEKCTSCNEKNNLKYFSFRDNGLKCEACGKQDKSAIEISEATEKAIKFIVWAEPKKIFSFEMSDENKTQLNLIAKIYLNNCLEKEY